jgi:hypothetical protein
VQNWLTIDIQSIPSHLAALIYRSIPKGSPRHASRRPKAASSVTRHVDQKRRNSQTSLDSVTHHTGSERRNFKTIFMQRDAVPRTHCTKVCARMNKTTAINSTGPTMHSALLIKLILSINIICHSVLLDASHDCIAQFLFWNTVNP